jgi:hypothetical protein
MIENKPSNGQVAKYLKQLQEMKTKRLYKTKRGIRILKDVYGENFENAGEGKNFCLSALKDIEKLEKEIEELTPVLEYFIKENEKDI